MNRIEREKRTVALMIRLYCRKKEGNRELCNECRELEAYAHKRLTSCKYGEQKALWIALLVLWLGMLFASLTGKPKTSVSSDKMQTASITALAERPYYFA